MLHAIKVSLKDHARRFNMAMNPLYRNPVVVMSDSLHLSSPLPLANRDLAHQQLLDILKANQGVLDAIAEMDGEYVLKAAIDTDSHMLRVNSYRVWPTEDHSSAIAPDKGEEPLYDRTELDRGVYTYTVVGDRANRKAVLSRLIANMGGLLYIRWDPTGSWEIELSRDQLSQLGLTHF